MPEKQTEKAKMVDWFDPRQLVKTGLEAFTSTVFGKHADRRLIDAALIPASEDIYYDFSDKVSENGDFWLDYTADTGDGWDSTYAVARLLAMPELNFSNGFKEDRNGEIKTRRGEILIFGGDQVYPTATDEEYRVRLMGPYRTAFPGKPDPHTSPAVFAIPGNHDWYDSLSSFTRRFIYNRWVRKFAAWRGLQKKSYFAIKLPYGWWLFGSDVQLNHAVDRMQQEYFLRIMERHVNPEDRIIFCNAEPYWIFSKLNENDDGKIDKSMGFFEGQVLNKRTKLFLAGDLHHYRRHANDENGKHKITAGGGGAFLHPTHGQDVKEIGKRTKYTLRKSYPNEKTSQQLGRKVLLFPYNCPFFGVVIGLIYALTAGAFLTEFGNFASFSGSQIFEAFLKVVNDLFAKPFALIWTAIILGGSIAYADNVSRAFRIIAGLAHGIFHLAAIFFLSLFLVCCFGSKLVDINPALDLFVKGASLFVGGYFAGGIFMGIYLYISLNWFGFHGNEAFGSLANPDYKNFVRIRINKENHDLKVFPVGIDEVPKGDEWQEINIGVIPAKMNALDENGQSKEYSKLIEEPFNIAKIDDENRRVKKIEIPDEIKKIDG